MGLDMFLDGVKYTPYRLDENNNIIEGRKITKTLEMDWRKANQIHKWFVDNIQWGEDNCHSYQFEIGELYKLLDICKEVLNSNSTEKAKELLPTHPGPFFGTYEYDKYYYQQIEETINGLERILKTPDKYDWFEYSSSW